MISDFTENRLFYLDSYGDSFITGICADGRQVVMGLLCPHLVAYFFDSNGAFAGGKRQLWKYPAQSSEDNTWYGFSDPTFKVAIAEQINEWQQELGFYQSIIKIQEFFDDTYPVGISILPGELEQDEIEAEEDPEERAFWEAQKVDWLANSQFVWWWAKDYYMSKEGNVNST
jgi:hypothetical protein